MKNTSSYPDQCCNRVPCIKGTAFNSVGLSLSMFIPLIKFACFLIFLSYRLAFKYHQLSSICLFPQTIPGCFPALKKLVDDNAVIIIAVALGIAVLEVPDTLSFCQSLCSLFKCELFTFDEILKMCYMLIFVTFSYHTGNENVPFAF